MERETPFSVRRIGSPPMKIAFVRKEIAMKKFAFSLLGLVMMAGNVMAADWADLKMTFKLGGAAPAPAKANVDKDQAVCGKFNLKKETLVVGKDGGIANVFVYLVPPTGKKAEVCPDLKLADSVEFDNKDCRYSPHAVVISTKQKLVLGNKDPIGHNVKGEFLGNSVAFNDLIPSMGSVSKSFTKSEAIPFPVSCSIHGWMTGYVLVREDPYATVSDDTGAITIAKLPVGKHTFAVWHEGAGFVSAPKVGGKPATWKKGRVEIEIKAGGVDFGTVEVPVEAVTKNK